jgi:hypothetical protein
MIRYHNLEGDTVIAEVLPESVLINGPEEMLDIMADAGYNGSRAIIVHSSNLTGDFFDLKTGVAGEILQKFSNYRMKLAIVGDFNSVGSRSLRDFIRESNNRGIVSFVHSENEALAILGGG